MASSAPLEIIKTVYIAMQVFDREAHDRNVTYDK